MSFRLRGIETSDLNGLYNLSQQFVLLNLPADKKVLAEKIEKSIQSFAGDARSEEAEFLFVAEDTETGEVVGSSQVIAKHGTPECPHLSFELLKKNRSSQDLGIGFVHTILRFKQETDGPTEIGGLLVDRGYRRRPEKVGKQISLVRFLFMAMQPQLFQKKVLCELTPPLTEEGRSEFWEALGRRFTGLPYQEADSLSQLNKEFIQQLFPEEDIYLSLLNSKARLVLGRVGDKTQPAKHLLESIGFQYLEEVDPFDGGPHYGAEIKNISIVKGNNELTLSSETQKDFSKRGLVGIFEDGKFRAVQTACEIIGKEIIMPKKSQDLLEISGGATLNVTLL